MSRIKFNHVFALLLLAGALGAFAVPEKYATKPLPAAQALFAPVSMPTRRLGEWARDRFAGPRLADKRSVQAVVDENIRLTNSLSYLREQLEAERRRNKQWAPLADLRDRCVPLAVGGGDSGTADSLALPATTLERVADGAFALYPGGVAGRVRGRAGFGGAQLRLITDRGMKVVGHFVRRLPNNAVEQTTPTVVFEGAGDGVMLVRGAGSLTMEDVQKGRVRVGDVALLDDRDWPQDLHGQRLGVVTKIEPMREQRQFAEIRVEPPTNLMLLNEVMVFVK